MRGRPFAVDPLPSALHAPMLAALAADESADDGSRYATRLRALAAPTIDAFARACDAALFAHDGPGYVLFDLSGFEVSAVDATQLAHGLAVAIADPMPFNRQASSLWTSLGVDLQAHPMRAHGVGLSPLHVDLMTWQEVPRLIAFFMLRPDPAGGGATELADLRGASRRLSPVTRSALQQPEYSYWRDSDVDLLGSHLPWFAVLPQQIETGVVRYTRKLLDRIESEPGAVKTSAARDRAVASLHAFHDELLRETFVGALRARQLLLFDQHRFAHSRLPLGPRQDAIAESKRRLLQQCYLARRRRDQ